MLPFSFFQEALTYERFLTQFGSSGDKDRWDRAQRQIKLTSLQQQMLAKFTRQTNILVLAGAWCGDCTIQCAPMAQFAVACPLLELRYLDRDSFPTARQELQINGGNRVPVFVFYSEDGFEVARYGDRAFATYQRLIESAHPHDLDLQDEEYAAALTADWFRELERVQWILQLSPRLRRLHQD